MADNNCMNWLSEVKWNADGLVPVIAQELSSGDVLMFAWMNREALEPLHRVDRLAHTAFPGARGAEHCGVGREC